MPRYYCDYCDTYLTHDSASVRKQHNAGYKHKANVRAYYAQFFDQDGQRALEEKMIKMQSPGGPMMNPMGMPMRPPMGGMPPFMGDPMGYGRGMPPGPMGMPFPTFPRPGMGPGGSSRPSSMSGNKPTK